MPVEYTPQATPTSISPAAPIPSRSDRAPAVKAILTRGGTGTSRPTSPSAKPRSCGAASLAEAEPHGAPSIAATAITSDRVCTSTSVSRSHPVRAPGNGARRGAVAHVGRRLLGPRGSSAYRAHVGSAYRAHVGLRLSGPP